MTTQLSKARCEADPCGIARIHQTNGKVVGAGFLVSDKHILTCAHVVNAAVGRQLNAPEEPNQEVCLDFPLVASGKILRGRVVRWIPVQPTSSILPETGADIALLELESTLPEGTQPVRLIKAKDLWKHPFRVFGFPEGQAVGVWTDGIMSNPQANGRVQIEVVRATAYRIEPGFSGSPVWDDQLDGFAGMTVAIDGRRPEVRAAFIIPTTQLINACPELEEQAIPPCPYRGLFAFREQDAKFFFGRDTFTQQLVKAVRKQSLVAVIGASGSGKSSVVFAGLIPQLRSEEGWLIEDFRPGALAKPDPQADRPFYNLAARLVPLLETEMSETDQLIEIKKQAKALQEGELGLEDVVRRILENNSGSRLLLIADQFEELYTLCQDNSEGQLFLDQLLEAVKQTENFTLVLTLRADFLGYALSYRPFADALQDSERKLVGPMNRGELQEVIEKPAQLLGVRLESGLTERILEAVDNEPGELPLLEFALTLLWAKQQNGQLTHQAYEEIGGMEKALAEYAEEQYGSLSEEDKQRAQRVFIQLVRPGEGTEDTRRLATRDEVGEDNWDLVTWLASARLVVTNKIGKTNEKEDTEQETVEIIHEALIREWENLQGWVESDRNFRTWQERLRVAMRSWKSGDNVEGALLHGVSLTESEGWLKQRRNDLSRDERDFIQQSLDRRLRLRRRTIWGMIGISGFTLMLAGVAGLGWQNAEQQRQRTFISQLGTQSQLVQSENDSLLQRSVLLAIESKRRGLEAGFHSLDADITLRRGLTLIPSLKNSLIYQRDSQNVYSDNAELFFSSNGKYLVFLASNAIRLLEVNSGRELGHIKYRKNWDTVTFSSNAKYVASYGKDNSVEVWNLDNGKKLASIFNAQDFDKYLGSPVYFSSDSRYLAINRKGLSQVWEITDTEKSKIVNISAKDKKVFKEREQWEGYLQERVGNYRVEYGNIVTVWELSSNRKIMHRELVEFPRIDDARMIALSPNGKYLAAGTRNGIVRVWEIPSGKIVIKLRQTLDWVYQVDFNPNGDLLAISSGNDFTRILEIPSGKEVARTVHDYNAYFLAFTPDGQHLLTTERDDGRYILRTWKMISNSEVIPFAQANQKVQSITFSLDGKYQALIFEGGTVLVWEISSGKELAHIELERLVNDVAFTSDGKFLAVATYDGIKRIWDITSNREVVRLEPQLSDEIQIIPRIEDSIAFSPDGKYLISQGQQLQAFLFQPEALIAEACSRLTRNLTEEEWQQYLPNEPYRKTCPNLPI